MIITTRTIVEYIDNGKFLCGLVRQQDEKRLHILNQNDREVSLPTSRVVVASKTAYPHKMPREKIVELLKSVAEKRQELCEQIDLFEIWELASQERQREFPAHFLAELLFDNEITEDQEAAFFRSIFADRFFFKYKNGMVIVHTPEQVEQLRYQHQLEEKETKLLKNGAAILKRIMSGAEPEEINLPEVSGLLEEIKQYYLFGNENNKHDLARQLLKEAELTRTHDPFFLLVRAGIWDKNENISLLKAEQPVHFDESSLQQAMTVKERSLEELLKDDPKRKDFTDLHVFTIDGAETKDFDDAIHLETIGNSFLIGIHITDITTYIQTNDPLFKEAAERSTSLYFPDNHIPMLPDVLSENILSLIKGKQRPALSFIISMSAQGEVLSSKILPTVIMVKEQLTYEQAEEKIKHEKKFAYLEKLCQKLRRHRVENGALLLPFPDVVFTIEPDGEVRISLSPIDTPARSLVAELMILANNIAASFLANNEAPGLFRSQGQPRKRIINGLETSLYEVARQRRFLSRGELNSRPKQHSGLGLSCYTTVTSPIRRFLDMAMQHQLNSLIRGQGILFNDTECNDMAVCINKNLSRANNVRLQRQRFWTLRYLERKVNSRVNGIVIHRGPVRTTILLTDCLIHVDLPPNPAFPVSPGDRIMVKISHANALNNTLLVEW